jgi:hypothetical protein
MNDQTPRVVDVTDHGIPPAGRTGAGVSSGPDAALPSAAQPDVMSEALRRWVSEGGALSQRPE